MIEKSAAPRAFRQGITFHSFTEEYCSGKWSFEDMMELATHLGGGVEIVGPAHQRGFPRLTIEFERMFKSGLERFGLTPTSYGSYADPFMLPDRDLNVDELTDYTRLQLLAAAQLGFPVMRLQNYAVAAAERLLPLAERLNVRMGYELHAPMTFGSDITRRLIEQIQRLGSPFLTLIPDCGIFAHSIPAFRMEGARAAGVPEALIVEAVADWHAHASLDEVLPKLKGKGLTEEQVVPIELFFGTLADSQPKDMIEFMPIISHLHGKFFSIVGGDEPNVRYGEVVKVLMEGGFDGWLSTEYEGPPTACSFAISRAHQDMVARHIQAYGRPNIPAEA